MSVATMSQNTKEFYEGYVPKNVENNNSGSKG